MDDRRPSAVERYVTDLLVPQDDALERTTASSEAAGLPPHAVTPPEAKLLHLLARIHGAKRILEVGALAGYSTIWLARALPPGGSLLTIEAHAGRARLVRANVEAAGLGGVVEVRTGAALDVLPSLTGPFDFVFLDADKPNNPAYLEWALRLARPGAVIVADNVVREGAVADGDDPDERVRGVRQFLQMCASEPRLETTVVQTVGSKGYDGFALALVTS